MANLFNPKSFSTPLKVYQTRNRSQVENRSSSISKIPVNHDESISCRLRSQTYHPIARRTRSTSNLSTSVDKISPPVSICKRRLYIKNYKANYQKAKERIQDLVNCLKIIRNVNGKMIAKNQILVDRKCEQDLEINRLNNKVYDYQTFVDRLEESMNLV